MEEAAASHILDVYPGTSSCNTLSNQRKQRRSDYVFVYATVDDSIIIPAHWSLVSNKEGRLI